MSWIEEQNLKAFNRLLAQKEIQERGRAGNYRYYNDSYGNIYAWYTQKQKDGKFHAFIQNARSNKMHTRIFSKRNKAKAWVYARCIKAKEKQQKIIKQNAIRKAELEAAKPKLTQEQITAKKLQQKIEHYQKLQKKTLTKIRSLNTRYKKYQKRIKYCEKRLEQIQSISLEAAR